ncbi:MAG: toll/interleukin-1 receptor domain-containing protein [Desulfobaccales bacterium]
MIVIVCETETHKIAKAISADLAHAYKDQLQVAILIASDTIVWPAEYSWDDLLIVIYQNADFPKIGKDFISEYRQSRGQNSFVLPVSVNLANKTPPEPVSDIKAILYDDVAKGEFGRIANRVGAILGLRIRHRDHKIFISYRAVDGNLIAQKLNEFLEENGFRPWLDEAPDRYDGEPNIPVGTNVQAVIEQNLKDANLIVLIDTPKAPQSRWLKLEIDTANAHLIPILPICFRPTSDKRNGPHFSSLRELQRWVDISWLDNNGPTIDDSVLYDIMDKMETYLCDIYRRKLRVPNLVQNQFVSRGFSWEELDRHKYIYDSLKQNDLRIRFRAISHCSIFDEVYKPALKVFAEYCDSTPASYLLYVYDGEILSEIEMEDLYSEAIVKKAMNLIILHNQEVSTILDSIFAGVSL